MFQNNKKKGTKEMTKVMFVCTGNICRSAMAEGLLKKRLEELGKKDMEVYSCGIFAENGDYATYNAIEAAENYNTDIKSHRATNIQDSNIEEMDLILCMSKSHKYSVLQMYPELKGKVYTLKEYVEYREADGDVDIKDPWGYDSEVYRRCIDEISICIEMLLQKIYQIY